jgi:ATP-dependent Lon protease
VLDPEQNNTFRDHYLDVPFDLSESFRHDRRVLIDSAARDRMGARNRRLHRGREAGATDQLVDKQVKNHGLTPEYIGSRPTPFAR